MTPSYLSVMLDGTSLQSLSPDAILVSADIIHAINQHSTARIVMRQTPDHRFPIEDWIGHDLKVAGYDGTGAEVVLFEGLLTRVELEYEIAGPYNLLIEGASKSIRMDQSPCMRSHRDRSFIQTFNGLGEPAGLTFTRTLGVSEWPDYGSQILQMNESDFSVCRRVIDWFGCSLLPTADGFEILERFLDEGIRVAWRVESGLHSFKLTARTLPADYFGSAYERQSFQSAIFPQEHTPPYALTSVRSLVINTFVQSRSNVRLKASVPSPIFSKVLIGYEQELRRASTKDHQAQVYGIGQSREATIKAGRIVEITGPIDAAGKYGVKRVHHMWRPDGYRNEFHASANDHAVSDEHFEVPSMPGLVVARVVELGEAEKEGHVKIQFYWEEGEPFLWARFMTPYAGKNRGIYFSPEVGDEVLVGFEFGNPQFPIIVGSMWNGVEKPPTVEVFGNEYQNNDVKRIVTKSGNRVVMDDKEGKEAIIMATPKHVRVSLFDGGSTLLLHSDGDIHINAGGTVHMKCAQFLREVG